LLFVAACSSSSSTDAPPLPTGGGTNPPPATPPGEAPPPPAPNPITGTERCTVADLEAAGTGLFVEVTRIRVGDDGAVYMLWNDKVHRYTVSTSGACTLTPDPAFGTGGSFGGFVDSFDLGPPGKITVSTFDGIEVHDRTTGAMTYACADMNGTVARIGVSADGTTAYVLGSTDPAKSKTYVLGASSCTSAKAFAPATPWATNDTGYAESVLVTSDSIVVGAQEAVLVYGFDGSLKRTFGKSQTPQDWKSTGIAYGNDALVSAAGTDVVDTNEPGIHRFDATGAFVKWWSITDLTGEADNGTIGPHPLAIATAPTGERWLVTEAKTQELWRMPAF
jgi:hypothetical protein